MCQSLKHAISKHRSITKGVHGEDPLCKMVKIQFELGHKKVRVILDNHAKGDYRGSVPQ